MNNRVIEIDQAKGIGILLVLFGHSIALMENPVNTFILSFHMPLFFFLSGMVLKYEERFFSFIKKKVKIIGTAIIIQYLLYVITGLVVDVWWKKSASIFSFDYIRGMNNWFLFVMLLSIVLAKLTHKYDRCIMVVAWLIFLVFSSESQFPKMYAEQALFAYVLMIWGGRYGNKLLNIFRNNKGILFEISMFLLGVTWVVAQYNGACAMSANIYGRSKIYFSITALLGTIGVLCFVTCGVKSELLEFCGKNSMFIFVTHFSVQKIMTTVWNTKFINLQCTSYPYYIVCFVILLFIEIMLLGITKKIKLIINRLREREIKNVII